MGAQCACNKATSNQQLQEIAKSNQAIQGDKTQQNQNVQIIVHQVQAMSENIQEMINDQDLDDSNLVFHKKQKRRVQLVIPNQQEIPNDNVIFKKQQISESDRKQILSNLKTHFIMSQLTENEKQVLVSQMRYCKAQKDTYIFKKGDASFSFYIILSGKCAVEIDGQVKKQIGFSESFGDLGIAYSAPRSASILAKEECLLVELNRNAFCSTIDKLNAIMEEENRKVLENLEDYNKLNQQQKNALAANSITQIYEPGQIIFNKGDDANSFYIVREGIVLISEKKIEIKQGENVGLNAILNEKDAVRGSTLIAKTRCKLLSITKEMVRKNLGDNMTNIIKKNMIKKLIQQSCLNQKVDEDLLTEILSKVKFEKIVKGEVVFETDTRVSKKKLYVILGSNIKNKAKTKQYQANSLIQPQKFFNNEEIIFKEDFIAEANGFIALLKLSTARSKKIVRKLDRPLKESEDSLALKDFIVIRKLRSGNFGQVYACYNVKTNKKYALKVMDKNYLKKNKLLEYVQKEDEALKNLSHPFLVEYYTTFTDKTFIQLVLELIEGEDFFDAMNKRLPIGFDEARFYIAQVLLTIEYLHNQKYIYRDLKPENLIIGFDGYLKMVDLGTAKKLTIAQRYRTKTIIGTPHYMAPEVITGKGYSFSADLWSIGVLMYEMLFSRLPFGEKFDDPFKIYEQIITKQLKLPMYGLQKSFKDFLQQLLNKSARLRQGNGIIELKKNTFFQSIDWQSLLEKKLPGYYYPNPSLKITFDQITKCINSKKRAQIIFMAHRIKQTQEGHL